MVLKATGFRTFRTPRTLRTPRTSFLISPHAGASGIPYRSFLATPPRLRHCAQRNQGANRPSWWCVSKESLVSSATDDLTPSLAQLVADAIVRGGASVAAFARAHDIPYVSLMKLINSGQPPRRKAVLDPLALALGITEATFNAALAKSKSNPLPAEAPRQSDNALNPFHAALLRLVEERQFTTKAFAEASDLSVLTAAKLLKRGELPGRQTTHEKLKALLGLSEIAYRDLLASSRNVDSPTNADGETGAIERKSTQGYVAVSTGAAPASTTKGELFELIDRLSPAQLVALKNFLLSVL